VRRSSRALTDVPRHRGSRTILTWNRLIDLRPMVQITGHAEFCEMSSMTSSS
jgi:hypothetical protein